MANKGFIRDTQLFKHFDVINVAFHWKWKNGEMEFSSEGHASFISYWAKVANMVTSMEKAALAGFSHCYYLLRKFYNKNRITACMRGIIPSWNVAHNLARFGDTKSNLVKICQPADGVAFKITRPHLSDAYPRFAQNIYVTSLYELCTENRYFAS